MSTNEIRRIRYATDPEYKKRVRKYYLDYNKRNVEKIKLCTKKYREKNKEKIRLKNKRYYEANKKSWKIYNSKWASNNREKLSNIAKNYRKTSLGKNVYREIQRKYQKSNKLKVNARSKANRFFTNKKPCYICGSVRKVEKHHEDYTKPLLIKWVCISCHHNIHSNGIRLR